MESFKKRQKEMQRQERQRDKMAKRLERKLHRASGVGDSQSETPEDAAQPPLPEDSQPAAEPKVQQ